MEEQPKKDSIEVIRMAKERAEKFQKSLEKARSQEREFMEKFERERLNLEKERSSLDAERKKWNDVLAEKDALVQSVSKELSQSVRSNSENGVMGVKKISLDGGESNVKVRDDVDDDDDDDSGCDAENDINHRVYCQNGRAFGDDDEDVFEGEINDIMSFGEDVALLRAEITKLRAYKRDAEGKLQFRLEQVIDIEEQRDKLFRQNRDLLTANKTLKSKLSSVQRELEDASRQLLGFRSGPVQSKVRALPAGQLDTFLTSPTLPPPPPDASQSTPMSTQKVEYSSVSHHSSKKLDESLRSSTESAASLEEAIKAELRDTKAEIKELARASLTQDVLQRHLDNNNFYDNDDDSEAASSLFLTRGAESSKKQAPTPTVTSSILDFSHSYEGDDSPLMSSVTNLRTSVESDNNSGGHRFLSETPYSSEIPSKLAAEMHSLVRPKSAPSSNRLGPATAGLAPKSMQKVEYLAKSTKSESNNNCRNRGTPKSVENVECVSVDEVERKISLENNSGSPRSHMVSSAPEGRKNPATGQVQSLTGTSSSKFGKSAATVSSSSPLRKATKHTANARTTSTPTSRSRTGVSLGPTTKNMQPTITQSRSRSPATFVTARSGENKALLKTNENLVAVIPSGIAFRERSRGVNDSFESANSDRSKSFNLSADDLNKRSTKLEVRKVVAEANRQNRNPTSGSTQSAFGVTSNRTSGRSAAGVALSKKPSPPLKWNIVSSGYGQQQTMTGAIGSRAKTKSSSKTSTVTSRGGGIGASAGSGRGDVGTRRRVVGKGTSRKS